MIDKRAASSCECASLVYGLQSILVLLGYPRPSLAGVGIYLDPPMCLDAQDGIKAKRQPLVVPVVVVKSNGRGRGRRDVLS